jgi:hypothetical protein
MAFREVTMLAVKEILRLWLRGVPKKQIAQQLGFDVKTVRRYLDAAKARGVEQAHGLAALDVGLIRFGGQCDYAACLSVNCLSNSAGLT